MTQRVMTGKGPRFDIIELNKDKYDAKIVGKILSDYRTKKISWKSIPKLLKNKHDIEMTQYQCQKIFKEYIK